MSRFGASEPFIDALLQPLVAAGALGEVRVVPAKGILDRPAAWPSVFVSSADPQSKGSDSPATTSLSTFEQLTEVLVRVQAPSGSFGDGKRACWALVDLVIDAIQNQVPTDTGNRATFGPLLAGTPFTAAVDEGEYGVVIHFTHEIYWITA